MGLVERLKDAAEKARGIINNSFAAWKIEIDYSKERYVITSPQGSPFSSDNIANEDQPKTNELINARKLYGLIVLYQKGSKDLRLEHLRNGKSH